MPVPAPSKRERIVEAALALFGEKGFDATSVQEVVAAAGATKGAFYHWFASKDDLLRQLHEEFTDEAMARFRAVVDEGRPPPETLAALIEQMVLAVGQYRQWVMVFIHEQRKLLSDEEFFEATRRREQLEGIVVRVVEDGVRSGHFRPVRSAKVVAYGIIGMCAWAHRWFRPGQRESAAAVARMYADLVLDGLSPRPVAPPRPVRPRRARPTPTRAAR